MKIDPDLRDLLPTYLERRRRDVEMIRRALASADYAVIQTLGHRLSGNAGSFGLDSLGRIGRELELAAQGRDHERAARALGQLERYLANLNIDAG